MAALGAVTLLLSGSAFADAVLLNVSYDPTRELYQAFNAAFAKHWVAQGGEKVSIKQSHGGSGRQARAVIDGLEADVVTLALAYDIDEIANIGKLLPSNWQSRLPNNSSPYTSTIVFLVRKGNPKGIRDWDDLVKPNVAVITPNPKTSGGARWNYLAAWGYAQKRYGSAAAAKDFVAKLYANVPVLDSGARGSTVTFAQRKIGDVHLTWENEARLEIQESKAELEIVYPPLSILAEPPVAVVDANVQRHGTRAAAEAYLNFLYTDHGQEIIAKHFYRPVKPEILQAHAATFPDIKLFPVTAIAKSWTDAYAKFFGDGQIFDSIYKP
jgi:sulfate transport system substrate-binding protein